MALAIIAEGNDACKIAYCRVCFDVFKQNLGSGRRRKVCFHCSPSWKPAKTCLSCGIFLKVGEHGHKFCSPKCRLAYNHPKRSGQCECCGMALGPYRKRWCSECAKAQKRKAQKNKKRWRVKWQVSCQNCGSQFRPIDKTKSKYCSHACAFEGLRKSRKRAREQREAAQQATALPPHTKVYLHCCKICEKHFYGKAKRKSVCSDVCAKALASFKAKQNNKLLKVVTPTACKECGSVFRAEYGDKRKLYCSRPCAEKVIRRSKRSKERARLKAARVETVDPFQVFNRDGWRCQICHKPTPRKLRGTISPNAPELDHIVPLAQGGEHSYGNTQCACRKCNASKSDRVYGQLNLFVQ